MAWTTWWVWVVAGFALGVVEVILPGYVFLGFAIGAVVTGALVGIGLLGGSLPFALVVFAVISLAAWLVLRRVFMRDGSQVKVWHRDIND